MPGRTVVQDDAATHGQDRRLGVQANQVEGAMGAMVTVMAAVRTRMFGHIDQTVRPVSRASTMQLRGRLSTDRFREDRVDPKGGAAGLDSGRHWPRGGVTIDFHGDVDQLLVNAQRLSDLVGLQRFGHHQ